MMMGSSGRCSLCSPPTIRLNAGNARLMSTSFYISALVKEFVDGLKQGFEAV